MKKVFLLMAMTAFVFACGGGAATQGEGCDKAKKECATQVEEGCCAKKAESGCAKKEAGECQKAAEAQCGEQE